MAATSEKVMSMVEEEIRKNPDVLTKDLFEKAKKIDKSITNLTIRQFNARYPLQVKRRNAPPKPRRPRRRGAKGGNRDAVRAVLLDYARELAGAEDMGQIVSLVAGVDEYVDRVMKAAS